MAALVDYIRRLSPVQCVANKLFLTLEQVFGRIKSLSVYTSTYTYVDRKVFFARTFHTPTESCFSITARKNCRG